MAIHVRQSEEKVDGSPGKYESAQLQTSDTGTTGSPILTTKVSLQVPDEITFETWERAGVQLAGVRSSSCWWLGDWLNFGKEHFSDRYERAIDTADLRYQTLRNYAWVAASFPPSRRRPTLSFQHHAEVASLRTETQDRWLDQAQQHGWSVRQLRDAVRKKRESKTKPDLGSNEKRQVAVPNERFQRWNQAATNAGTDVEEWIIATLDTAADEVLTA